jgi:hypothetical protein
MALESAALVLDSMGERYRFAYRFIQRYPRQLFGG